MSSEDTIKALFGDVAKNINIGMINVNSYPSEGTNDTRFPNCSAFLKASADYVPRLLENFNDEKEKFKETDPLVIADKIFTPIWFSPSSMKSRTHPIPFDGDHRTEKKVASIGTYSSKQVFVNYENTGLCAALASKVKYSSKEGSKPELLVLEDSGYGAKEVDYCYERGICNTVGIKTSDYCRYLTKYKNSDGKTVVSLICGDYDFVSGPVSIFKNIFTHVETIKAHQRNKKRNGLDLADKSISFGVKKNETGDPIDTASVALSRLIGGSIITHDYLCVLRDIFKVKKLMAFDTEGANKVVPINIQSVIDDYSRIKKYYAMVNALKMI